MQFDSTAVLLRKIMYWWNFDSACDIALTVRTLSMTIGNSIGYSNQTNQSCVNQLLQNPSISPSNHFGWNYFEMGKHSRMWKDLGRRFPSPLARVLQTEWICFPWGTSTSNVMHSTMHCTIVHMTHSQMLGKFEYTLPAKFWRLVGCTEMLSW